MTTSNPHILNFISQVKVPQTVWALQDKSSEGWVVLDSVNYEETDVMPLWSSKELAQNHCTEEWADYVPAAISVADWMEYWVEDLAEDNVMIGVNWQGNDEHLELELAEFSQLLAAIESFQSKP